MANIRITLTKSAIGYNSSQRATLKTLGLKKIRQSVVREDSPVVRGQIMKVKHLVTIEEETDAAK